MVGRESTEEQSSKYGGAEGSKDGRGGDTGGLGDGDGLMGMWTGFVSFTSEALTSISQTQPPKESPRLTTERPAVLARNLVLGEQDKSGAPDSKDEVVVNQWLLGSSEAEIRAELEARARKAIDEIQARARNPIEDSVKRGEEKRRQASDTISKERRARDLLLMEIHSDMNVARYDGQKEEGRLADDSDSALPGESPRCAAVLDLQPRPFGDAHSIVREHEPSALPQELPSSRASVLNLADEKGYTLKEKNARSADYEAQAQAHTHAKDEEEGAGCFIVSKGVGGHCAVQPNQACEYGLESQLHGVESQLHGVESQLHGVDLGAERDVLEGGLLQGRGSHGRVGKEVDCENGQDQGYATGGGNSIQGFSAEEKHITERMQGRGSPEGFTTLRGVCAYDGAAQDAAEGEGGGAPLSCPPCAVEEGCHAVGEGRSNSQTFVERVVTPIGDAPGKSFGREAAAKWLEFENMAVPAHCVVHQHQTELHEGDECRASHQDEFDSNEDLSHLYYTGDKPESNLPNVCESPIGSMVDRRTPGISPSTGGLGLLIRRNPGGAIVVAAVARGSAADGHLVEGDRILCIDGCSVAGMRSGDVFNLLSGSHPDIKILIERSHTSFLRYSSSRQIVSLSRGGDTALPRRINTGLEDWAALLCGDIMSCQASLWRGGALEDELQIDESDG